MDKMDSDIGQILINSTIFKEHENKSAPTLTWVNVAIGMVFILINCAISIALGLKLEKSLIIAALRCLIQLTIMGYILEDIFKAQHPALVMLMSFVLILLGAYETVYNKSKQTYHGMFPSVLISSAVSTLFIGIIGVRFAIHQKPFWYPEVFIPTMGMLLGNAMSAIAVALGNCLSTVTQRREQIETYLSFGASRWEAGQSIAVEAVRLAMLPTINQMSVIGLIAIPGMMTGQILGGASVDNAVKYQQIIMFLISATSALAVLSSVVNCITVVFDGRHRLRPERIISSKPSIFHDIKESFIYLWKYTVYIFTCCRRKPEFPKTVAEMEEEEDENRSLLRSNNKGSSGSSNNNKNYSSSNNQRNEEQTRDENNSNNNNDEDDEEEANAEEENNTKGNNSKNDENDDENDDNDNNDNNNDNNDNNNNDNSNTNTNTNTNTNANKNTSNSNNRNNKRKNKRKNKK